MAKAKVVKDIAVDDPVGIEWHRNARDRWNGYMDAAEGDGTVAEAAWARNPEPLPDFAALRPAHITRDVFGRFVQDRTTGIVHDITKATEDCDVDGIVNATFYHFWTEVVEAVGDDIPCPRCVT